MGMSLDLTSGGDAERPRMMSMRYCNSSLMLSTKLQLPRSFSEDVGSKVSYLLQCKHRSLQR